MNRSMILAGCLWATMVLVGCGDSGSPSDTDNDLLSSKAEKVESSSSAKKTETSSSSSTKKDSSDDKSSSSSAKSATSTESRPATLKDLNKNMVLSGLFGRDILMATGNQTGLFSLWIPDTAWVVVRSEFEDGVLKIDADKASVVSIEGKGVIDSMKTLVNKGKEISFIVDSEDKLKYSLDGKKYHSVRDTSMKVTSSILSTGDSLAGKALTCKSGDTTEVFSFYKGRYVWELFVDEKSLGFAGGYFDIQRNFLLLLPEINSISVPGLRTATVFSDYKLAFSTGLEQKCSVGKNRFKDVPVNQFASSWGATESDLDWEWSLKSDGRFALEGRHGATLKAEREGTWVLYGDVLLMINESCLQGNTCSVSTKGRIVDFDSETGFTFEHEDEGKPVFPSSWSPIQYE